MSTNRISTVVSRTATKKKPSLPIVNSCDGCGVCCLHMGYPAFMLPRNRATNEQIDSDPELQMLLKQGWSRQELLDGHPGEKYWHELPAELKSEWCDFTAGYQRDAELDGPCYWFDQTTRQCRHHEHRPQVCRDFEIGSRLCRQWRDEYREMITDPEENKT